MDEIVFRPIGYIHSDIKQRQGAPIQSTCSAREGRIEILPEYEEGLRDLDGFSHIYVLFHFHLSKGYELKVKPFLDKEKHGIFAVRAPRRPNQIGLSIVNIVKVDGNVIYFKGADMLDGTPVIDIKPYVPGFDVVEVTKSGWIEKAAHAAPETSADDRFVCDD